MLGKKCFKSASEVEASFLHGPSMGFPGVRYPLRFTTLFSQRLTQALAMRQGNALIFLSKCQKE